MRLLDVELIAQTDPDIRITSVAGGHVTQVGCRVAPVVTGPERRPSLSGIGTAEDQVGDQVMPERRGNRLIGPVVKPLGIGPVREVSIVRGMAGVVQKRLEFRVRVAVAHQREPHLLEVPRVARHVLRQANPGPLAPALAARQDRVVRVAHDVRVRPVRPPIPPAPRAVVVHDPEPVTFARQGHHRIAPMLALKFRSARVDLHQRPFARLRRAEPHLEDITRGTAPPITVPESLDPEFGLSALVPEPHPELHITRRRVRRTHPRPVERQIDDRIHLAGGQFLTPRAGNQPPEQAQPNQRNQ